MKKIVCFLMSVILVFATATGISADESTKETLNTESMKITLSEMTDEECVAFLQSAGVTFPYDEENVEFWGPIVKNMILVVEENPGHIFAYNFTKMQELANAVKRAVNEYYGIEVTAGNDALVSTYSLFSNGLRNSTLAAPWTYDYLSYNCYGYATGEQVFRNPGYHSGQEMTEMLS